MAEIGVGEAAARAGISRVSIWRAIKTGRLSAQRDDRGTWRIDEAELHRAFPEARLSEESAALAGPADATPRVTLKHDETVSELRTLRLEVQMLRQIVTELQADKAALQARLETTEQQAVVERARFLALLEGQTKLLADQRQHSGLLSWLSRRER